MHARLHATSARRLVALGAAFSLLLAACGASETATGTTPTPTPTNDAFARVGHVIDSALAAIPVASGASFVVVRNDTVLYEHDVHINPSFTIELSSATKWPAALTLMSLVDDGTMSLDDSVGKYILNAPAATRDITVRQLFSHTAGLSITDAPCLSDRSTTLAACANQILSLPLRTAPGTDFGYGGNSMQVAARLAELASGTPWPLLVQDRVADPLGLTSLTYGPTANPRVGAGLAGTTRDFLRVLFVQLGNGAYHGNRVVSAASVSVMESDQTHGVPVTFSPLADKTIRYGIGLWRDRVDATGTAVQLSSPGELGYSPWIDRQRNLAAIFAVQDQLGNVSSLVAKVQQMVRDVVDGK